MGILQITTTVLKTRPPWGVIPRSSKSSWHHVAVLGDGWFNTVVVKSNVDAPPEAPRGVIVVRFKSETSASSTPGPSFELGLKLAKGSGTPPLSTTWVVIKCQRAVGYYITSMYVPLVDRALADSVVAEKARRPGQHRHV